MATRSYIGKVQTDGKIKAVYCHRDGHLSNNGAILQYCYQNESKIDQLLDLGDLSSLGPDIGTRHPWEEYDPEMCTFYTRDRGESSEETKTKIFDTEKEFLEAAVNSWAEYIYLWSKGKWNYCVGTGSLNEWIPLEGIKELESWLQSKKNGANAFSYPPNAYA